MSNGELKHQNGVKLSLDTVIRSDLLPELINLARSWPGFAPLLTNLIQIRMVIDAHIAQQELRWRLGRRQNPTARTRLHEAILAGVIVPFAPTFLDSEIEEHVQEMADATHKSVDGVRHEWQEFRKLLHFYSPKGQPRLHRPVVDPDDLAYIATANELGAPVYSRDRHYRQMNASVISVVIDATAQSYARGSSVRIAVMIGSSLLVMLSCEAITAACRCLKRAGQWFAQLHPAVQFAIVAAAIIAIAHPKSRAKLESLWQWVKGVATPPLLQAIAEVAAQFTDADRSARAAYEDIQRSLPAPTRRSALMHARAVCLMAKAPLRVPDIERRMRAEGYVSRAKDFGIYLRRVLAASGEFAEVGRGMWVLKGTSALEGRA